MTTINLRHGMSVAAFCGALLAAAVSGTPLAAVLLSDLGALCARSDARRL